MSTKTEIVVCRASYGKVFPTIFRCVSFSTATPDFNTSEKKNRAGPFERRAYAVDTRSFTPLGGSKAIRITPMRQKIAEATRRSWRSCGRWIDIAVMTAACAMFNHAANVITPRFADGSRAANSKKIPCMT